MSDYLDNLKLKKFIFYRVPKELFTNEKYTDISAEAKLLYGMLLDKMSLSEMNGWREEEGVVFQYFTIQSVQKLFKIGHDKAGKLFKELEKVELIERKSQGIGRPYKIYLKVFQEEIEEEIEEKEEDFFL